MAGIEIRSLGNIGLNVLFEAFDQAFAEYEVRLDKRQFQTLLKRRGFDPDLSFAAFDDDRIVAFTCNGIGNFNGAHTAYDTGTGTLKDYRGQGLATKVFGHSLPYLRKAGIGQYLLEVLQHNTKAVSVYRNIGFEVTREFNYFRQENQKIRHELKDTPYAVRPVGINDHYLIRSFWDFEPSWQNSLESIWRSPENFICLGAFDGEKQVGYCVFEPTSGDITQIGVDKPCRRKGIASLLLYEMLERNECNFLKVINTDIGCESITGFLLAKNIALGGKQFEMRLKI